MLQKCKVNSINDMNIFHICEDTVIFECKGVLDQHFLLSNQPKMCLHCSKSFLDFQLQNQKIYF